MLYNLHLLRVVAALSVVYYHVTSEAGLRLEWSFGSRGVDIFFVISGFIIAYIGTRKPEEFFRRRLIRIVPFYWAATLAVFALAVAAPGLLRSTNADFAHLFTSLLFIPHESVTGEMSPTIRFGWSLNFEMFFYATFAIALAISRKWSPLISASGLLLLVVAAPLVGTQNRILSFYALPIVLEFCYGIALFYLVDWCCARRDSLAGSRLLLGSLSGILVVGLVALYAAEIRFPDVPRYIAGGIPAALVVSSALLLERIFGLTTRNRALFLLGEASYITYLIHPYVAYGVLRFVVTDADRLPGPAMVVLMIGLFTLVSGIAVAIHLVFERPVMAFLRTKLPSSHETSKAVVRSQELATPYNAS